MQPLQERDPDRLVAQFKPNRPSVQADGATVLDLIHQAANLLQSVEDRAAATEARALTLARQATEQLDSAESRIREMQSLQQATEAEAKAANARANEAEQMLREARSEIAALENRLSTTEVRARNAEARFIEAEKILIRVEDAIRTQLLSKRDTLAVAA